MGVQSVRLKDQHNKAKKALKSDEIEEYQLEGIRARCNNNKVLCKVVQMEYKKLKNTTGYQAPVLYNTSFPSDSPDLD